MFISWLNIIPANLRGTEISFLNSVITGNFDNGNMIRFIKMIGYLMYEREEKISIFNDITNKLPTDLTSLLNECQDDLTFSCLLNDQLHMVREMLDNIEDMFGNNGEITNETLETKRGITLMAQRSLEQILHYLSNEEFCAKSKKQNQSMRQMLKMRNNSENTGGDKNSNRDYRNLIIFMWFETRERILKCDNQNDVESLLMTLFLKDFLLSTAIDTPGAFQYILRTIILLTFYLYNFYDNTNIKINLDSSMIDEEIVRCVNHGENINCDNLIATSMIFLIRMYFFNCLMWPIDMKHLFFDTPEKRRNFRYLITKELRSNKRITFPWLLSVNNKRKADESNVRDKIYIKYNYLLGMFEDLGFSCEKSVVRQSPLSVNIRANLNEKLQRQINDFEFIFNICKDLIKNNRNNNELLNQILNEDEETLDTMIFAVLAALDINENEILCSIFKTKNDNDNETVLLSCALMDLKNFHDLFLNMELNAMYKLYKIRVAERLIRNFIEYMVDVWNAKIGLCNFTQLSEVTLEIYKLLVHYRKDQNLFETTNNTAL